MKYLSLMKTIYSKGGLSGLFKKSVWLYELKGDAMSFSTLAKTPIYEVFGRPKKVADVGIELEIEGTHLPTVVPHWTVKPEGSLQDGIEYITKPIKADVVKVYVDNLKKFIQLEGGTIKPSYRCSTHIHVNVLPETMEDMLGFMTIFVMFEPLLLSLCGPGRDGNLFCMSSYDTGDAVTAFDQLCTQLDHIKSRGFAFERGKYSALNTGRLADLGTLEARCFPLSVDGDEVSKWVGWLLKMKDMAKAEPDKTYRSLWKNVRQNPMWYANVIFGVQGWSVPNTSSLIDLGTETAYEFTKILKKWHAKPAKEDTPKAAKKKMSYTLDDMVGLGNPAFPPVAEWNVAPQPWPAPASPTDEDF